MEEIQSAWLIHLERGTKPMKCLFCENEIPDGSRYCNFCGKSLEQVASTVSTNAADPQDNNHVNNTVGKKKKTSIILLFAIIIGIALWAFVIHLWGKDAIAFELITKNATDFHSPRSVRVISGTAGESEETGKYAFVTLLAENAYGAERSDYYVINEEFGLDKAVYSLAGTDYDFSYYCKEEKLNTWKINLRLTLYWLFK